jgi:hypothetical protein
MQTTDVKSQDHKNPQKMKGDWRPLLESRRKKKGTKRTLVLMALLVTVKTGPLLKRVDLTVPCRRPKPWRRIALSYPLKTLLSRSTPSRDPESCAQTLYVKKREGGEGMV